MSNQNILEKQFNAAAAHPIREPGETKTAMPLLVDLSGSEAGCEQAIRSGIDELFYAIKHDDIAKYGIELNLITFNDEVLSSGFASVMDLQVPTIQCDGGTEFYKALECALTQTQERYQMYKDRKIHSNQPIYFIISDGVPTDRENEAYRSLQSLKDNGKAQILSIAIGNEIDMDFLKKISNGIVECKRDQIRNAFRFISHTMTQTSHSRVNETVELEPQKFGLVIRNADQ